MSDSNLRIQLKDFKIISLEGLNSSASFLKRLEKKYLLNSKQFLRLLPELKKNYNILEINWRRVFNYDNVYMDTENYLFYEQHQNWIDSRVKARTRFYVDSNLAYFEFKHKINWVTNKYRYEFPAHEHWFITKWKKRFFDWVWQSIYNIAAPDLTPSLKTKYKRITMVSKKWDERLTFDFEVNVQDLRKIDSQNIELKNLIIIESKSLKQISTADRIMEKNGIQQYKHCSKYCLGIIYSWLAEKFDTFKETMAKVKEIRMETVKVSRNQSEDRKWSLNKIINNIKKETREKVKEIQK